MVKSEVIIIIINTIILIFLIEFVIFISYKFTNHQYFMNNFEYLESVQNKSQINPNELTDDVKKIAIFGGSSSAGYGSTLSFEQILNNYYEDRAVIHNFAKNGASLHGFQDRIIIDISKFYDVIIIYSGHNEIWSQIFNDYHQTITHLESPDGSLIDLSGYVQSEIKDFNNLKVKFEKEIDDKNFDLLFFLKNYSRTIFFTKRIIAKIKLNLKKNNSNYKEVSINKLKFYDDNELINLIDKKRIISNYKISINNILENIKDSQELILIKTISNDLFPPMQLKINNKSNNQKLIESKLENIYQKMNENLFHISKNDFNSLYNENYFKDGHFLYLSSLLCLKEKKILNECIEGFRLARGEDDLPYRVLPEINEYLETKKNLKKNINVIDIEKLINNYSLSNYLDIFVDIHHPSEKGHLLIANEIIKSIEKKDPQIKFFDKCYNYIINKNGLLKKHYINQKYFKTNLNININWLKGAKNNFKANFLYDYYIQMANLKLEKCL